MLLDLIRKVTPPLAVHLPPIAAMALFSIGAPTWAGYACCLLALGYIGSRDRLAGVGNHLVGRILVVAAGFANLAAAEATSLTLVSSGVVLAALVAYEPKLQSALTTGRLRTANLKVQRTATERALDPRAAYLGVTALTVGFLTAAVAGAGGALVLGASLVVAAGFGAGVLLAWRRRRGSAYQGDAAVLAAVTAHRPRFMVHFNGIPDADYQLLMWLPYLDRLGDPYLIVLRDGQALPRFAAATDTPLVVAPRIADLEYVIVPTIRAAFYVNNGMQNAHCVRVSRLTHVQLMHGDSDKPASYNPVSAMYDRVFVAGQAGVDRYADHGVRIPAEKFRIVGRPQAAGVRVGRTPIAQVTEPVALYAPTWTGFSRDVDYCSLPIGERIVTSLLGSGATVILRAHPYTRRNPAAARQLDELERMLAADRERTGRAHRWGDAAAVAMSLTDCVNAADVMVCDVSGVASDWLYSEKPFAITDMRDEGESFHRTFPLARAAYVIRHDASDLDDVMQRLLRTDPAAAVRREVKAYYLGDFPEDSYVEAFLDEARRCYAVDHAEQVPVGS